MLDSASPPPLLAQALLTAPPASTADPARLVLVAAADDGSGAGAAAERVRRVHPGRPLAVYRVPWPAGHSGRSRDARIAALVRAYGHHALPVLLTLTPEGQVVRIESLAGRDE